MRRWMKLATAAALAAGSVPVVAQQLNQSDGERLLEAVAKSDGGTAVQIIEAPGSRAVNYRGYQGDTALHIVTRQRNLTWVKYLLGRNADPNIGDRNGDTALILAARIGFPEAVEYMTAVGANLDAANRQGETALIVAVQQRQPKIVQLLLQAGADPDKPDHAAGLSARDYAKRDSRNPDLLKLIETIKSTKKKSVAGPKL
ncbi:ankyrin repeat domain-containing protein [Sphingomonas jaspsi]|uniref:ankyrin repeat domain-containing protein n=1 Tax=Sphingomonas jaspsi TaxID=392409 RepID=UPI000559FAB1|nr:ankyrin repeat domain-containing protein [Sphingomonas jaspsi]